MTPDRSAVKKVLESALDRPANERSDFLANACGADDALRAEVESLLAAHVEAAELLEHSPSAPDSLIGTTVGSYRILEMLGAGGMGEVYLALDTRLGRRVALKFLSSQFTSDPERVRRFRQEAQAASSLNHPNILTIYELGEHQGVQFIASELVEGETLRARLERGPMELSDIVRVASHVASALGTAHAARVVHRDIKPENIMLRPDGHTKVLDFGLAKLSEPSTPSADANTALRTAEGAVMGTTPYMSPEQVRGQLVDSRTDQWSLGVVLHEMLSSQRPFQGATGSDVIAAILEKEPPPLRAPEELRRITAKTLRKKREERYATADDLFVDLTSYQKELGADASRPSLKQRAMRYQTASDLPADLRRLERDSDSEPAHAPDALNVGKRRSRKAIHSVAILPFDNASGDPEAEYFSDGVTESVTHSLSQLPKLKVMARSMVLRYKGRAVDPQRVGRELGVAAVVTGRVIQRGDSLVIGAELVDVANGWQLWGAQYSRTVSHVFAMQEELASEIAERLRLRLSGDEKKRLRKRYTESVAAYQAYLRGRYHWNKRTREGLEKGLECFAQALEEDPAYALAYAGLADSYALLGIAEYGVLPPRDAMPKARAAAQRALEIDDTLGEAQTQLAHVKAFYEWDWLGAEREFKRALELSPGYAFAHHWYALYLTAMERLDEAIGAEKRAQELDPLSPVINKNVGTIYYYACRYDQAIAQYKSALEMDPNFARTHFFLGLLYEQEAMFEDAVAEFRRALDLGADTPVTLAALGHAYAMAGKRAEAEKILDELRERSTRQYVPAFSMATVYAGLGEKEQTYHWLERAYEERSSWLISLKVEPIFAGLRSEQRFQDLMRRVGLPLSSTPSIVAG